MTAIDMPVTRLRTGIGRELVAFVTIGLLSTAAYATLYLVLRPMAGPFAANAMALGITAVGNTAANRRLTFGVQGWQSMLRDQLGGLIALGIALTITSGAALLLFALVPGPARWLELAVLLAANAAATLARFVVLRAWIRGPVGGASAWSQS
jgi:putative flippase GtrA